jgi:hypothetical protein
MFFLQSVQVQLQILFSHVDYEEAVDPGGPNGGKAQGRFRGGMRAGPGLFIFFGSEEKELMEFFAEIGYWLCDGRRPRSGL